MPAGEAVAQVIAQAHALAGGVVEDGLLPGGCHLAMDCLARTFRLAEPRTTDENRVRLLEGVGTGDVHEHLVHEVLRLASAEAFDLGFCAGYIVLLSFLHV